MSWLTHDDPIAGDAGSCDAVDMIIVPRTRDLGGFDVRRVLPATERQMIGPFIFFDEFGPAQFLPGKGIDVRPHPHIGLSTVTWLFEGQIFHRDSLGTSVPITPGELNWMTAGRGIVHSERTPPSEREKQSTMSGIQSWVALPADKEEVDPGFWHFDPNQLPVIEEPGKFVRLISGILYGETSPVQTASDQFYAEAVLKKGAVIPLPADYIDRGVYVVSGEIEIDGQSFEAGRMVVLLPGETVGIKAIKDCRVMLLGGEPMEGERYVWWNFVSSSKERIEQAKNDWREARFDIVPGDEEEFIPLP